MEAVGAVVRRAWVPVVFLLGAAINLAQRDVEGTLMFASLAVLTTALLVPDEQSKLQVAAIAVGVIACLAVLAPRLYVVAERL